MSILCRHRPTFFDLLLLCRHIRFLICSSSYNLLRIFFSPAATNNLLILCRHIGFLINIYEWRSVIINIEQSNYQHNPIISFFCLDRKLRCFCVKNRKLPKIKIRYQKIVLDEQCGFFFFARCDWRAGRFFLLHILHDKLGRYFITCYAWHSERVHF